METSPTTRAPASGLKRSCLPWVGVYFGLALLLGVWFSFRFPEAPPDVSPRLPPLSYRLALAFGAGLIGAIPGALALAGFDGVRTRLLERARLVKAAAATFPVDGAFQPFFGRIVASGPMLVAPLSGRECLLYHYEASHSSGGSRSSKVTDAEGYALTPSHLDTLAGRIHLLAYLEPEFTPERLDAEAALERLRRYLPTAQRFEPSLDFGRNYREAKEYLLDSDGTIRFDHGRLDATETAKSFDEQIVQHGDEVAVFGMYSAERQGIVPDPAGFISHQARLRKGSLSRLARGFVGQAVLSGVVGLLFAAAFGWWVYAFFQSAASF